MHIGENMAYEEPTLKEFEMFGNKNEFACASCTCNCGT